MKINQVNMSIRDYCAAFDRNEIRIDPTYQRSPEVWPAPARSYLIETLLKGFPVPKLAIHQTVDSTSRRAIKNVVDGQQRTMAILDFRKGDLRLSRSLELPDAASKVFDDLSEELTEAFLSYLLTFDQFEAAGDEVVREYFRRINSYTAPLNAEEQRHARFQGPMKWFIHGLGQRLGEVFVRLGVLRKQRIIRMGDVKLLAELVHALIYGVTTTSKATLDAMYLKFDKGEVVEGEDQMRAALTAAVDAIVGWPQLHTTSLMRMHVFYSLVLAVIRVRNVWKTLATIPGPGRPVTAVVPNAVENLLKLAAAFDDPEAHPAYADFAAAAAERTNVKAQRETRVHWLAQALTDPAF